MRISMIGTRGVPATYGGFETAIEEIGKRLVHRGHDVTVYCRRSAGIDTAASHEGMRLVHLPAIRSRALETLSHTALSTLHGLFSRRQEVAFVFNAANAPFVPLIRARGVPVAVHVDGLEWKRAKWGRAGQRYYRAAEALAVATADALIADAEGIASYYRDEFDVATEFISYGSRRVEAARSENITRLGLRSKAYHLVVARFEPENHVEVILRGFSASAATLPMIVVGSAPYSAKYTAAIESLRSADSRIVLLGAVWDQELLDDLYENALTYVHGHSVGGTNPSLLRAMGAGTAVLAWDVSFNREVLGSDGLYFSNHEGIAAALTASERDAQDFVERGQRLREDVTARYNWDDVAREYESLAERLVSGSTIHGVRRRRGQRPSTDSTRPFEKGQAK